MDELRQRAIQLIDGQARIESAIKRWRFICVAASFTAFALGIGIGLLLPYQIQAVHVEQEEYPSHHE